MSMTELIGTIDGDPIYGMSMPIPQNYYQKRTKPIVCPLCQKRIEGGETGYFIGCNFKYFNNVVCHKECIEEKGGYDKVFDYLKELRAKLKKLNDELSFYKKIGWVSGEEPA